MTHVLIRQHVGPCLALAAVLVLASAPARAEDRPQQGAPARAEENAPQVAPQLPDDQKRPGGGTPPVVRELAPAAADDRGSVFVDAGLDRENAAVPNALELEKLAAARAAVKASRDAGTLHAAPPQAPLLSAPEIERLKQEQLAARQPQALPGNDGSGAGEVPPPVQQAGPPGLNAHEQAKLAGDLQGAPARAGAESAAPAPTREQADGQQREGGR